MAKADCVKRFDAWRVTRAVEFFTRKTPLRFSVDVAIAGGRRIAGTLADRSTPLIVDI